MRDMNLAFLNLRTDGLVGIVSLKYLQTFKTIPAFNLHHQIAQTLLGKPAAHSKFSS